MHKNESQGENLGTHEVDGFGGGLLVVGAPGLAPEPVLRERLDAHLMNHVVRQVLVEVRQAARVGCLFTKGKPTGKALDFSNCFIFNFFI